MAALGNLPQLDRGGRRRRVGPSAQAYAHANPNARFLRGGGAPQRPMVPGNGGQAGYQDSVAARANRRLQEYQQWIASHRQGGIIGAGAPKNPLEHQRYWAAQGVLLGPQGQRFRARPDALRAYLAGAGEGGGGGLQQGLPPDVTNGGMNTQPVQPPMTNGGTNAPLPGTGLPTNGGTNQQPGTGSNGGGSNGGGGAGGGAGGVEGTGLPIDPVYEAQRRLIEDQLAQSLATLGPLREQIAAQQALQAARLNTNEGVDVGDLMENLASRGALGGGVQRIDRGQLATDYLRQRQDLANAVAGQYADLAGREGEFRNQYSQGLIEALLAAAQRAAADPGIAVEGAGPSGGGNRQRRRRQRRH